MAVLLRYLDRMDTVNETLCVDVCACVRAVAVIHVMDALVQLFINFV